jgi:cell division protease FtsH
VQIELAATRNEQGMVATERFFAAIEEAIKRSRCYRGKVLSMEVADSYSGTASGLMVHRLKSVDRAHVILAQKTLDLLDRNVINFARRRPQLAKLGMATKKGLLFYGPPGVGKTHTVNYLATNLPGHTTLLITGEQVGRLPEYMTLARLYQPSIVVIEDVDLIARHREEMRSPGEEVMLNKLLNEMDGTSSDAEIIFILTTNRVAVLEEALSSRPGRIDQAVEFPLPTAEGRTKLVHLYSHGITVSDDVVQSIVKRTELVSASFIKELMRRCVQFSLDRNETSDIIELADVDAALDELLVAGGSLNQKLLGAVGRSEIREMGFIRRG